MQWQKIDEQNAEAYLRANGRIAASEQVIVRTLSGGVSNIVLLVARTSGEPIFVLKQAREQLRVAEPWFCSVERIWREVDVLEVCQRALSSSAGTPCFPTDRTISVPRVLFCDRSQYLYAMSAAPAHRVWKQMLLDGVCDISVASACAQLLGIIHAATWAQPDIARQLADRSFFEQLRVDPYYRHVARKQPNLGPAFAQLIQSLSDHPHCLVHGDFSPKNILVYDGGLMLVDFEVGHFGDPAFDIGFFLSHLVLKAFRAGPHAKGYLALIDTFWEVYQALIQPTSGPHEYALLMARGLWNLSGCLLARTDGKSQVDYLTDATRSVVRPAAQRLLCEPVATWPEFQARLPL